VEQFVALDIDTRDAVERTNAENTSGKREFIDAAYIVGGIAGEA